jgi:serine/threonine-protein kinase
MGGVYEASSGEGERAAVKVVRRDRLADPAALERFGREAQVLMRVDSPSCARVVDLGLAADPPYVATELVAGPSLSAILRTRERLPTDEVAELVGDLARGLRDVHAAGVVHLDLKPSNSLFAGAGATPAWRLVDFGVARLLAAGDGNDPIAGTPQYMAPEQAAGERVDTRSDLYSLTLVIYRALVGRPAFTGTDRAELVRLARDVGPPDPRPFDVDDAIALCLRIGLAFRPEDRFATATELRSAFASAFTGTLDARWCERGRDVLARAPWAIA